MTELITPDEQPFEGGFIITVAKGDTHYELGFSDTPDGKGSTHIGLAIDNPGGVVPEPGQKLEFYGKGMYYTIRGMRIDGVVAFYSTEEQSQHDYAVASYGKDAAEMLERWDAGKSVWTIEIGCPGLGRMGPNYEIATQIIMFEAIRLMLDPEVAFDLDELFKVRRVAYLGPSGAMMGNAAHMAAVFVQNGPVEVMAKAASERKMQLSANPPSLKEIDAWLAENPAEKPEPVE